jgi:hypothetical protein
MGIALLHKSTDKNTQLCYAVIVNFKAYVCITADASGECSQHMKACLNATRKKYLQSAMAALGQISFMFAPSLPLFQCLVTVVRTFKLTFAHIIRYAN